MVFGWIGYSIGDALRRFYAGQTPEEIDTAREVVKDTVYDAGETIGSFFGGVLNPVSRGIEGALTNVGAGVGNAVTSIGSGIGSTVSNTVKPLTLPLVIVGIAAVAYLVFTLKN